MEGSYYLYVKTGANSASKKEDWMFFMLGGYQGNIYVLDEQVCVNVWLYLKPIGVVLFYDKIARKMAQLLSLVHI